MRDLPQADLPLNGLTIVDFSQFLSGPVCTLKLAVLGARVIKVERPGVGDLCRHLYLSDTDIDGDNTLFPRHKSKQGERNGGPAQPGGPGKG